MEEEALPEFICDIIFKRVNGKKYGKYVMS